METFLPTLPARGATCSSRFDGQCLYYFYPRSPRGERPTCETVPANPKRISTHAPREGSDIKLMVSPLVHWISTHAPREGSDPAVPTSIRSTIANFYPRSPRGERRMGHAACARRGRFLSTLPARGATWVTFFATSSKPFLSTLPARGATFGGFTVFPSPTNFYPRSPRGERRRSNRPMMRATSFLSTLPARGATFFHRVPSTSLCHFYPRSPRGERR